MSKEHPNWKDRSTDPDGFAGTLEAQMMADEMERLLRQLQTAIKYLRDKEIADGVPLDMQFTGPKHNRVGIDNALIGHGGLVALLIEKGVIKAKEYYEVNIEFLERDVERYKDKLKEKFGMDFELH